MSSQDGYFSYFRILWLRLATLGAISLVFGEALWLAPGKAQGWAFYLTTGELVFEVAVRLVAAAVFGVVLGTICAAIVAPLLGFFKASRETLLHSTTTVAVLLVLFLLSRYALEVLIKWSYSIAGHPALYDKLLMGGQFVVFGLALCFPRSRRAMATSFDGFLSPKMTRRTVIATLGSAAAVAVAEFALSKSTSTPRVVLSGQRPKSNFLLITFDALDAEDMSLYGRPYPTTPNIDAFSRQATVFTKFYSASTFTTPSVAAMLTGLYPSESEVYQLQGHIRASDAKRSLPFLLRDAGYETAAFLTNPFAYYVSQRAQNGIDIIPEPAFHQGWMQHIWNVTTPLHQDSGIGSRVDEYVDLERVWSVLSRSPGNLSMRYRPAKSFEHAKQILADLPEGYFLWLHVITPHNPYLPDAQDRGRFLPESKLNTYEDEFGGRWKPHYPPDQQHLVDQRRLRYDEFIATADRNFGAFMKDMESSGKLSNTTVIVSADHGEGFEGGVYQHSSPYLTRPVIHIPLIVKTPGQKEGRRVEITADQTALAPTILDLAGMQKPASMRGPSLAPWLSSDSPPEDTGVAFCQYFERNSVYKPLRHGTVGVISGEYQYVVYLDTQKGELRPLSEAQVWNLDRSAENPERANALRAVLNARFPDVVQLTK